MRQTLKLHPESQCSAAAYIDVDIARPRPGRLVFTYIVAGKIGDLRLPPLDTLARTDDLWRHTCFEAFLGVPGGAYHEFNFAPSTQWAAYRFDRYRDGMCVATEIAAPRIDVHATAERFMLEAALELDRVPVDPALRLALSAVIEEANGRKSYWALAHPAGKPDFHHADGFALELPSA